jgi:hypothetical protein
LKNLCWYSEQTADEFYPRCFKLSHEDDRLAFIGKMNLFISENPVWSFGLENIELLFLAKISKFAPKTSKKSPYQTDFVN